MRIEAREFFYFFIIFFVSVGWGAKDSPQFTRQLSLVQNWSGSFHLKEQAKKKLFTYTSELLESGWEKRENLVKLKSWGPAKFENKEVIQPWHLLVLQHLLNDSSDSTSGEDDDPQILSELKLMYLIAQGQESFGMLMGSIVQINSEISSRKTVFGFEKLPEVADLYDKLCKAPEGSASFENLFKAWKEGWQKHENNQNLKDLLSLNRKIYLTFLVALIVSYLPWPRAANALIATPFILLGMCYYWKLHKKVSTN